MSEWLSLRKTVVELHQDAEGQLQQCDGRARQQALECSGHQQQAAAKEATVGGANKWMGSTPKRASILDQAVFLWESHGIAVTPSWNKREGSPCFTPWPWLTLSLMLRRSEVACAHLTPTAMPIDCSSYVATKQVARV